MVRISVYLVAALLVASPLTQVVAQSTPAATSDTAKPSRMKLTMEKLKQMKATWQANRPKLKACRQEVKSRGLAGDDRWFYIQDCMTKA